MDSNKDIAPSEEGAAGSYRGGAVLLLARRIIMRATPPGRFVRWLTLGGSLMGLVGAVGIGMGAGVWALGLFGVGVISAVAGLLLWRFVTTIAVSAIGVALGVASLFTVLAVTSGFEDELLRRMGRINGHVLLTKYGIDFFEWEERSDELVQRPDIVAVSPFVYGAVAVSKVQDIDGDEVAADANPTVAALKGLDAARFGDFPGVASMFRGGDVSVLRPGNLHYTPPGAAVGVRLATRLQLEVGQKIRLVVAGEIDGSLDPNSTPPRAATFEVLDILETGVSDLDGALVLTDLRAAMSLLYNEGRATGIELALTVPRDADTVGMAVMEQLNRPDRPPLYRTMNWADGSTPIVIMRNIRRIVSLILSLIVLVAGSTLIGALLLIVRQRRRQIAILATMGATRRSLFAVFEAAGLVAGASGALAGLAMGLVLCAGLDAFHWPLDTEVYPLSRMPVAPQWIDAWLPATVAVLVCAIFSGPVALRAARTRPIDALRD